MSEDYRIVELSDNECWEILDRERFGRLAVAVHGDPDIFPVNFLVDDGKLLMRTAPGTKLTELVINAAVAVAGSDVANALFSYPTPQEVQSLPCRGSETVDAAIECDYSDTTGTVTLLITGNASNGYRVTNVGFVPAEDLTAATTAPG